MANKKPFWKSTKKTLGVIGFFLYWGVQVPAIVKEPSIVITLTPMNLGLVLGLLGLKTAGNVIGNKKGATVE